MLSSSLIKSFGKLFKNFLKGLELEFSQIPSQGIFPWLAGSRFWGFKPEGPSKHFPTRKPKERQTNLSFKLSLVPSGWGF